MSYPASQGPHLVAYNLTSSAYGYLSRLLELGAVEGPLGHMEIAPALMPLFEAIHAVLAGGEAEVKITHKGSPDIVRELRERLAQARKDANEINEKSGFYVTATG